jgi:integrase
MEAVKGQRYLWRRGNMLYFRRAVPEDARQVFEGRKEVWSSLKTASIPVARSRLQHQLDDFEAKLARARGELAPVVIANEPYKPSKREIEIRVRAAFKERIERIRPVNRHNPEEVSAAVQRLDDLKVFHRSLSASRGLAEVDAPMDVTWQAEALSEQHNWSLEKADDNWWALFDLVTRAQIEASESQIRSLEGKPAKVRDAVFAPDQFLRDAKDEEEGEVLLGAPVSILGLFESYVAERKPEPATVKSYRPKVEMFRAFLGHDDARRITKRDVAVWKDQLLETGGAAGKPLNPKTVRATYLSSVKISLRQGVDNGLLAENVANGVSVAGRKRRPRTRPAGFTDGEAKMILQATLGDHRSSLSRGRQLARRWIPWLCAYTGARVDEMAQLRAEDVTQVDGVWTIHITPEAGGTKSGDARLVAMHPHLIEQGFPLVVKNADGPIFYDPSASRGGSGAHPMSKKVGQHIAEWVRKEVGVTDKRVQPNHGWRHRFKTVARECRMIPEIRDYIQGHVPRNEGEGYGDKSSKATLAEIALHPKYEVDGT